MTAPAIHAAEWLNDLAKYEKTSGGQKEPVKEMLLTHPMVRPSYSFSTLLRSLAAAKLIVEAGPTANPPNTAPAAAAVSVGAAATKSALVIPRPERMSNRLGFLVRSYSFPPHRDV